MFWKLTLMYRPETQKLWLLLTKNQNLCITQLLQLITIRNKTKVNLFLNKCSLLLLNEILQDMLTCPPEIGRMSTLL